MEAPGFWDDPDISNQKMKELKNLKDVVDTINGLGTQYEDIELLRRSGSVRCFPGSTTAIMRF